MKESRITTNIAHLSLSRLKTVEFPIPPLDTQRQLCAIAEEDLGAIAQLKRDTAAVRRRNAALRRALLAAAFTGRLTGKTSDADVAQEIAGV